MKTKEGFFVDYIRAWSLPWDNRVAIGIVGDEGDNRKYFDGEKYCVIEKEGGSFDPAFLLRYDQAQQLMNSLWDSGIRPEGAKGSLGQLEAVKYHLEDMRNLVFETKGKQ